MFLWIGCKLPEEFEHEIRQHCLALNAQIGLDTAAFALPQHVSLKISFDTDRAAEILEDLAQFASNQAPFSVRIMGVEQFGNILWMPIAENRSLQQLHDLLDIRLESSFGIPQHEFDKCFKFHSTLFMDTDLEKVSQMHTALKDYPIDRELTVDTFLLGESETGKPGTCRIVRQIKV